MGRPVTGMDGMTDREALQHLLERFGLTPHADSGVPGWPSPHDVVLTAKHGGVEGYEGFTAPFRFDETGRFTGLDIEE
jgi:hypothetical protein